MKNYLVVLSFLLFLGSCGLFQPRNTFETPESNVAVDRFNFNAIMGEKRFTRKNYESFFCDTLRYSYLNSGIVYSKKNLIDHLHHLEVQYPLFTIKWAVITSDGEDNVKTITKVTYTVVYDSTVVDGNTFTGSSTIVIIRDGEYKIATWDDFPNSDQKSFFAPLD